MRRPPFERDSGSPKTHGYRLGLRGAARQRSCRAVEDFRRPRDLDHRACERADDARQVGVRGRGSFERAGEPAPRRGFHRMQEDPGLLPRNHRLQLGVEFHANRWRMRRCSVASLRPRGYGPCSDEGPESRPTIQAPSLAGREHAKDVVFIALVSALPALFVVSTLGFYLDDYNALMLMRTSDDQSLWGFYTALLSGDPKAQLRPLEYAMLAGLYWLFDTNPLPYQIFLATLVPVCAAMLYLVLVRITRHRYVALGVAIVFATAPHYSSARFWVVAFSPTFVLALYLTSVYCLLRALETSGRRLAAWAAGAALAMLVSLFIYEIALPLFVLTAAYFWYRARRTGTRALAVAAWSYALVLALAIVAKLGLALDIGNETSYSVGGYQGGLLHHLAYVTSGAIKINFGTYGLGLPYVLWWILDHRFSALVLVTALIAGVLVFLYLTRGVRGDRVPTAARGARWPLWLELAAAGLVLMAAGYGLFVVTGQIYMTSAGIDNRVNIVPALGMVILAVGLLLRGLELVAPRLRGTVFSLSIAVLAAAGIVVTNTIADYWGAAYARQGEVMERLQRALPENPTDTIVLLDRICPEIGPGVVFLAHYDLAGALRTEYSDASIEAAVMTDDVDAEGSGVVIGTTFVGVTERLSYPYEKGIVVYDWRRDSLTPLPDRAAARAYLRNTPRIDCPPLRSFAWGIRTSRWVPFA